MQDKQKVTLYLPPGLHRQLKIRAAVDSESMSAMVERAIVFYLCHPEAVEEVEEVHGKNHRVYTCPECSSSVVLDEGELVSLKNQPSVLSEEIPVEKVREEVSSRNDSQGSQGEEELVPC
jgi:plasmid stability protein